MSVMKGKLEKDNHRDNLQKREAISHTTLQFLEENGDLTLNYLYAHRRKSKKNKQLSAVASEKCVVPKQSSFFL